MTEHRRNHVLTALLVLLACTFGFVAGTAGWFPQLERFVVAFTQAGGSDQPITGLDFKQVLRVQRYIQQQFVEPVSAEKLTQGALKGMVQATGDRYSSYFTPTEYKRYLESFESSFGGIGVHVETSAKTGLVTVVSPIKGSPGERAGLRAGDVILAVDDKDITRMSLDEAVNLIRGPKGTKVRLTVRRESVPEALEFVITRATITMPSLHYEMLDRQAGVGYVQVLEFNKQIAERVQAALAELEGQGMKRLILDLRQNPGGLLDEAIEMASLFVPPNEPVVHIVKRGDAEKETYEAKATKRWQLPLVVLIDGGSASASEIVAGAIKDHKLGFLVGAKTFGKGSVQSFYDLEDGGGVKLTTARYLTAGGHSIHAKGIEPDLAIENPQRVIPREPGDVQLEAALRHIKSLK